MYLIIAFVVFLLLISIFLAFSYFTEESIYEEEFVASFTIILFISLGWPIGVPLAIVFCISYYLYDKIMEKKYNRSK